MQGVSVKRFKTLKRGWLHPDSVRKFRALVRGTAISRKEVKLDF